MRKFRFKEFTTNSDEKIVLNILDISTLRLVYDEDTEIALTNGDHIILKGNKIDEIKFMITGIASVLP